MRILLTANASYAPPRGGATRSNLLWLESLAQAGHGCRIVASALPEGDEKSLQIMQEGAGRAALAARGIELFETPDRTALVHLLRRQMREFAPDWVLVSSEDLGHGLLREAHHGAPGRVIYLAHTPQFFPFGPASWNPDAGATELVARCAAVIAIGCHTASYIREYARCEPTVIHPPIYGDGPFANLGNFDGGLITMVNPCAVKGIRIFLALADRFRSHSFGALPGWGTTAADRAELAARPNIVTLPNCRHIEEFLTRTRILLMPSLWYEGFGLTVMEAMLHGVPVIASDSGGLVEAKMGTQFVVRTPLIERYDPLFDEHMLPRPEIPPIDLQPWEYALSSLLADRVVYERISESSRNAALRFVSNLDARRMADFLTELAPSAPPAEPPSLAHLSHEKRSLLLRLARARKS